MPAAPHPLAVEFKQYPYTISECGRYECIGDRRATQRVPGVWPEIWHLLSTEQRAALRERCEQYQTMLSTPDAPGGGNAPASSAESGEGEGCVGGWGGVGWGVCVGVGRWGSGSGPPPIKKATSAPRSPRTSAPPEHAHNPTCTPWPLFNAAAARPVTKKELHNTPAAMQTLLKGAARLQARDTWDITSVSEWSDVAQEAKREGNKAHVGRIFPIVVQRSSELPDGHP